MKNARRFAAFFASCLMLGSTGLSYAVSAEDTAQADSYDYGDVNLDHSVDVSDAVLLARYSAEDKTAVISAQGKQLADVNGDGDVTKDDTVAILEYIAKKRPTLGPAVQPPAPVGKTVCLTADMDADEVAGKKADSAFISSQLGFAANLLRETDLPIGEIAARCGFPVQTHLNAVFRRTYGTTLRAYRNSPKTAPSE